MVLSRRSRGRLGGLRRSRPELRGQNAEAPEGGSLAAAARTLRHVPVHHRTSKCLLKHGLKSEGNATQTKMSPEFERKIAGGLIAGYVGSRSRARIAAPAANRPRPTLWILSVGLAD